MEPNSLVVQQVSSRRIAVNLFFIVCTIVWASLVASGLWWLWSYESTPGLAGTPPSQWPSSSMIPLAGDRPTLVMLAHPRCPCTRASLGELASVMAHGNGRIRAYVLFIKPSGSSDDWEKTDLWQSASRIPGVIVLKDSEGFEAGLLNTATSGHTLVYSKQGQLVFSGGITGSRGHFGDNVGEGSVVAILKEEVPEQTETSVFGCPLFNPRSECRESLNDKDQY